jgi:outer membrane protein assembly factor BamE
MNKLITLLLAITLTACAHKITIQQGNVITQSQFELLEKGMSKEDVRTVIGSPMIADPFHQDRWDYPFTLKKDGALVNSNRVTVKFVDNKLVEIIKIGDLPTTPLVE